MDASSPPTIDDRLVHTASSTAGLTLSSSRAEARILPLGARFRAEAVLDMTGPSAVCGGRLFLVLHRFFSCSSAKRPVSRPSFPVGKLCPRNFYWK